jgi:hypothetical protein
MVDFMIKWVLPIPMSITMVIGMVWVIGAPFSGFILIPFLLSDGSVYNFFIWCAVYNLSGIISLIITFYYTNSIYSYINGFESNARWFLILGMLFSIFIMIILQW